MIWVLKDEHHLDILFFLPCLPSPFFVKAVVQNCDLLRTPSKGQPRGRFSTRVGCHIPEMTILPLDLVAEMVGWSPVFPLLLANTTTFPSMLCSRYSHATGFKQLYVEMLCSRLGPKKLPHAIPHSPLSFACFF